MRILSVRLIVSLIIGITLVSTLSSYYEVRVQDRGLRRELERRAKVLGESLSSNIERTLEQGQSRDLQPLVEHFGNHQDLAGIAVYNSTGNPIAISPGLEELLITQSPTVALALAENRGVGEFTRAGSASIHIYVVPLHGQNHVVGALAIVHDTGYIATQTRRVWRETFFRALAEMIIIGLLSLLIVRWSLSGPIARAAQWMRALRIERASARPPIPDWDAFQPLAREVATFAESLQRARSVAEKEAQLRAAGESTWTAQRLAVHVHSKLGNSRLIAVSNREPYSHSQQGKHLEVAVPASGLVTALEPVLQACDGTWVAHGSGDADRETVDHHDRLRVPPDDPRYTLRRVWLSQEEEEGYYYGFANEGLWALCHIAHTRPLFRASDWNYYRQVNRKFADAVLEEAQGPEQPVVLVQDYHFALLPRIVKQGRPDARVAIFWHIPWPNPEAFNICPWQRDLLDGLLGADLIGFHVQAHCNNFMETVDRALESQIDWERFTVKRRDHRTLVRPFPISVDFNENHGPGTALRSAESERTTLLEEHNVEAIFLGVGVDRVDYTKGIPERFLAIERLLEQYPTFQQQFTFVQIAAPSRTRIQRYHDLLSEVEAEANRINQCFQTAHWKPIILLKRQHGHQEIQRYYRAADLCMVTSLHDGMNLVAKEYLAARHDEDGVLILSRFTGASRELSDALLVNPYDIDETADAIRRALAMDPDEKKLRMRRMRKVISDYNIYRWAGNLIGDLCEVRIDVTGTSPEGVETGISAA